MEGNKKDTKYKVCAVKVGNGVVMGYVPDKDNYVHVGDDVRIGDACTYGTVLLVDDYIAYEDMAKWEQLTGVEFQKIMTIYDRNEAKWDV